MAGAAVGQRLEAVVVTTDAREFFHVRIPRGEIVVADGPIGDTIAYRTFEIEFTPENQSLLIG